MMTGCLAGTFLPWNFRGPPRRNYQRMKRSVTQSCEELAVVFRGALSGGLS